jgi:transposase
MHAKLWWEKLKEGVCLEVTDIVGRIILKWILKETGWRSTDWISLAEEKDKWGTAVTLNLLSPELNPICFCWHY